MTNERVQWTALAGVFALALSLRAIALFELSDSPLTEALLGDSRGYFDWASEIAAGNWRGIGVFYQAPLYPYFLAVLMKLFGANLDVFRVVQIVLGSFACVFVTLGTARFFSVRAGVLAGILLALYPPAIFFDLIIQKTSVALFLMTALVALLSRFDDVARVRWPLLSGLCLAALVLTRENALILLPCIGLWILLPIASGTTAERGMRFALFLAGAAIILIPVGARNLSLGNQFLITTSQLGPNLFIGNNPDADGRYRPLVEGRGDVKHERNDARLLAERAMGKSLQPGEVSGYWVDQTVGYIKTQPGDWLRLIAHKSYMVLNAEEIPDTESIEAYSDESLVLRALFSIYHFGVLLPLGVFGLFVTRSRWRVHFPLLLIGAAMAAGTAAFFVMARYRFPLVPIVVMYAGAAMSGIVERVRNGAEERWLLGWLLLAATFVVSNAPVGIDQQPRVNTWYNVGVAMLNDGRFPEARVYLERAARATEAPLVHSTLGRMLVASGDLEAAVGHFEAMLEHRRGDPRVLHAGLAILYRDLERDEDARRHQAFAESDARTRLPEPAATLPNADD